MRLTQLFDLSGKTALITGGSRGLGRQMAHALGEAGARIALLARKQDELDDAVAELKASGHEAHAIAHDLVKLESIPGLVEQVLARCGAIDILVNNAGRSYVAPAEDYPSQGWSTVMDLNINALFFLTQAVAKKSMIPRRSGKIINISSIGGLYANPPGIDIVAYNTSKGAVLACTRTLAAEWGKYNINVNAICPGFFSSKMSASLLDKLLPGVIAATPLGRIGGDDDLKGLAVFFASEASRHITGQHLVVDGGGTLV